MVPYNRPKRLRLAFFAGGYGGAVRAIESAAVDKMLASTIELLVTNRPECGARAWASKNGVPVYDTGGDTIEKTVDSACCRILMECQIDLIILSGYLRKLGPHVLSRFQPYILNTHPALLPKFGGLGMYGSRVHKAVLAAGETQSGATVHIVDSNYDTGPVVRQKAVAIDENESPDSLATKVKSVESDLLIEVLRDIEAGSLNLNNFASARHPPPHE